MHERGKEDGPVFESALKKDDFPTLGTPGATGVEFEVSVMGQGERTDDTDLEVVAWATQQSLFLLSGLFGSHLFLCL